MPVGSIIGGLIGSAGASAAGAAAGRAGDKAYQNATDWAKQIRAFASPWISSGMGANNELSQLYGLGSVVPTGDTYNDSMLDQSNRAQDQQNALSRFTTSPGYQFRLQQGVNALDRSAAAKGMLLSGAQGKALNDYGQNQASQEWGNYVNALSGLSGAGLSANDASSGAGAGLVGQGINNQFQGAMGQASAYSSSANALANGIMNGVNNLGSIFGFTGLGKNALSGGGGGMGAAGTPGSPYYGPVYSGI